MTLKNNWVSLLTYLKLCASFCSHLWFQTGVRVQKLLILVKIGSFFVQCDLEIWQMTLKNNKAPLLYNIKLCLSFHRHMRIVIAVTDQKPSNWVLTSVTLIFDIWLCSLLASLYNPIVNPAMVSTVRFYDRNELYGSPDVRNCRMPNFLGWAFFVISLISIN